MKKSISEIINHYSESKNKYSISGESHLSYYMEKYPSEYKILKEYCESERILGRTNKEMIESNQLLLDVLNQSTKKMIGRGRNRHEISIPKYRNDPNVVSKLEVSLDYYKNTEDTTIKQNYLTPEEGGKAFELISCPPSTFKFRDYQNRIIEDAVNIIEQYGFVYLAMEVRTGKTLTSLGIANGFLPENVLFLTKKKAISSIENDYRLYAPAYNLTVINYESMHKHINNIYDVIILDEAHSMGAFPKPSKRALSVKSLIQDNNYPAVILLSGTPTPESFSQMYHQVYGLPHNPFNHYSSFYKFAKDHVDVKTRMINSMKSNDYSRGKDSIIEMMKPMTISFSQKQAGFSSEIEEEVLYVDVNDVVRNTVKRLRSDKVVEGKSEVILGDTPAKMMIKIHQLCSGTIKFESGNSMILDYSKAEFIEERFRDHKIAIFYKFTQELKALEEVFEDDLTVDIDEFNSGKRAIALQIVSGREGISLKEADYIVYYNIDFSATSYWQSRDRMTTKDRKFNKVYWVFSKGGIEDKIYKAVTKKKDYTIRHFKNDSLTL